MSVMSGYWTFGTIHAKQLRNFLETKIAIQRKNRQYKGSEAEMGLSCLKNKKETREAECTLGRGRCLRGGYKDTKSHIMQVPCKSQQSS